MQSLVLRWPCKTYAYVPAVTDQNALEIAGYRHEHPSQADLMEFMTQYRPVAEAVAFTVVPISLDVDGRSHLKPENTSQHPLHQGHGVLDSGNLLQQLRRQRGGLTQPRARPSRLGRYLECLDDGLDQSSVPQMVNLGYSIQETNIPLEYATALCDAFGARGASAFTASGDLGIGAGTAGMTSSTPPSPYPVRVVFNHTSQAVHRHGYKSLIGRS